jgi:hypothetical protein
MSGIVASLMNNVQPVSQFNLTDYSAITATSASAFSYNTSITHVGFSVSP